ncbi:hypothetical protein GIB67_035375 [Kingdonia uniflora]|uniref:Uncharacterized protein n=1 Tax=Kingdonia uniflora TaxID=39325 RepID=A0A7J7MMS4_9MAGN|nr:hypothetical protein GIB67_035375 [Kingdonia uniflora]
MSMEGFEKSYLDAAFQIIGENDRKIRIFIVSNVGRRKMMLEQLRSRIERTHVTIPTAQFARLLAELWILQGKWSNPSIIQCKWKKSDSNNVMLNTGGSLCNLGGYGARLRNHNGAGYGYKIIEVGCDSSAVVTLVKTAIISPWNAKKLVRDIKRKAVL